MAEEKGPDNKNLEEADGLLKKLLAKAKETEKTFEQLSKRGGDLAGAMQAMGAELGKSGDTLQRMGQLSEGFLKSADLTNDIHKDITSQIEERFNLEMQLATTEEDRRDALLSYNALKANEKNAAEALKSVAESQVQAQQDLVKLQVAKNTGLRGEALSAASSYQLMVQQGAMTKEQYNDLVKNLKEQQDITTELQDQLEMEEAIAQELLDIESNTESWGKSLKKTAATAKAIASDPKALGLFALNEVVKVSKKAYEGFEDLRHEGMSAGQALDASFKSFSVNSVLGLSDTKGAIKGLVDEFGTINNVSAETIDNIGTVAHEMGISGQEAASLTAQMSQMTGESTAVAAETLKYTNELAKANGIAPGKLTKEMAANTKDMHRFTKGGSKEFAKIAVEAQKIGISMDSAASAASGLLDFESSIEAQMEASVLLGKEINLDKARQLALEGDSVKAAQEVVKQMGGLAEFNSMNVLEQEAAAKAAGMSVDQIKKAMDAEQNKGKYAEENADQASEHAGHMLEVTAKMGGFLKNNAMLFMTMAQFIMDGNATKAIGYAKDMAHWVKEKAHIAWKKANEFIGGGAGGATDMASTVSEGAGAQVTELGSTVTEGATEKLQDKASDMSGDLVDKVADTGGVDKAADMAEAADGVEEPKGFKESMAAIRDGIQEFAQDAVKTLQGVGVMVLAGVMLGAGLLAITMGIKAAGGSPKDLMMVGIALAAFAGSLYLMSLTMGEMSLDDILQGTLALALLGAALIPAALAFSLLKGVDVGSIIAFSIALPLLGLAAAGLGLLGAFIMAGALALAALGGGMIAVALAFVIFQSGQQGMDSFIAFLGELKPDMALGMIMTAAAMAIFTVALGGLALIAIYAGPALALLGGGLLALGVGVSLAASGLTAISEVLPTLADGFAQLGAAVPGLIAMSVALLQAIPALFAFVAVAPFASLGAIALGVGMTILGAGVTVAAAGLALIAGVLPVIADGFAGMAESLTMIVSFLPAMFMMGTALFGMAAGLTAFAFAGILTLPTIMGLMALSLVAPILIALGDSINFDLGGGSSVEEKPEDDKMDQLIGEIRSLKAVMSQGGVINMDGTKVGDVLRLSMTNAGVQ